jgi:hypothetical protein
MKTVTPTWLSDSALLIDKQNAAAEAKVTKHFYLTTAGSYAPLAYGTHIELDPACKTFDCIQWLSTPHDMALTCTTDFDLVPLAPILYARINEHGALDVVKEIGAHWRLPLPHSGYLVQATAERPQKSMSEHRKEIEAAQAKRRAIQMAKKGLQSE